MWNKTVRQHTVAVMEASARDKRLSPIGRVFKEPSARLDFQPVWPCWPFLCLREERGKKSQTHRLNSLQAKLTFLLLYSRLQISVEMGTGVLLPLLHCVLTGLSVARKPHFLFSFPPERSLSYKFLGM